MELLFSNLKSHSIIIPSHYDPATISTLSHSITPSLTTSSNQNDTALIKSDIKYLIYWLRTELLTDQNRPELFSQGETM
jgi:ubiquitin related modifier 1